MPNPAFDSDGINIPASKREVIDRYNSYWQQRMELLLTRKQDDVVNEWEVNLLGIYLFVNNSNIINFIVGCIQFALVNALLFTSESNQTTVLMIGIVLLSPYACVMTLSLIMRFGVSLYVSDADIKLAYGWLLLPLNMFGYKFTWLSPTEVTDTSKTQLADNNNSDKKGNVSSTSSSSDIELTTMNPMLENATAVQSTFVDDIPIGNDIIPQQN